MRSRIDRIKKYIILLIIILVLAIVIFITYNGNIPVQWNGNQISSYMNKYFILLFPVIAVFLLMYLEDFIRCFIDKNAIDIKKLDFFNILSQIIIIGVEAQILLNLIEIRVNIIVLLILCAAMSGVIKRIYDTDYH